jgi:hypothetical protein
MSDCYEWIDPFAEIEKHKRRAAQSYNLGHMAAMGLLRGKLGQVLEAAWESTAHRILRDVVKPFAREWGDKAVRGISTSLSFDMARRMEHDTVMIQVAMIQPFRIQCEIDDRML